jgi:hypothetical protein
MISYTSRVLECGVVLSWAPAACFDFHGMDSTARRENFRHEYEVLSVIPRHRNIVRYLRQFEERLTQDLWALLPVAAQEAARELVYESPTGPPVVKLRRCQFVLMELLPKTLEEFVTTAPRLTWPDFLPLALDVIAGLRVRVCIAVHRQSV